MAAKRSGGVDNLCEVIDNHADLIDVGVENVSIPTNGSLLIEKVGGDTTTATIAKFPNVVNQGIQVSQQSTPNQLTFDLSAGEYQVDGQLNNLSATTVTLSNGDASFDRIDTVYLDSVGANVATGTPSATPVAPTLGVNEIRLKDVFVAQNATASTGTVSGITSDGTNLSNGTADGQILVWDNTNSQFIISPNITADQSLTDWNMRLETDLFPYFPSLGGAEGSVMGYNDGTIESCIGVVYDGGYSPNLYYRINDGNIFNQVLSTIVDTATDTNSDTSTVINNGYSIWGYTEGKNVRKSQSNPSNWVDSAGFGLTTTTGITGQPEYLRSGISSGGLATDTTKNGTATNARINSQLSVTGYDSNTLGNFSTLRVASIGGYNLIAANNNWGIHLGSVVDKGATVTTEEPTAFGVRIGEFGSTDSFVEQTLESTLSRIDWRQEEISSNTTLDNSNYILLVATNSGAYTITLPATPELGRIYKIKDDDGNAATNNINIDGNGINIDGNGTKVLRDDYASITLIKTANEWSILQEKVDVVQASPKIISVIDTSDLPAPVSDVITLDADKIYLIQNDIDLGNDRLVVPANSSIIGTSNTSITITSTTTGDLFTLQGNSEIRNINLVANSANQLINSSATSTENVIIDGITTTSTTKIGTFDGGLQLFIRNSSFINSTGGITLDGTWTSGVGIDNVLVTSFTGTNIIDVASTLNVSGRLKVLNSSLIAPALSNIFNFNAGFTINDDGFVLVDNRLNGGATVLNGITANDTETFFNGNQGLPDTVATADFELSGNTATTTIGTSGTYVSINNTASVTDQLEKFSRTGLVVTYNGATDIKANLISIINFEGNTGNVYAFQFYVNGSPIGIPFKQEGGGAGDAQNVSLKAFRTLSQTDTVEIRVTNLDAANDVEVLDMIMTIIEQ